MFVRGVYQEATSQHLGTPVPVLGLKIPIFVYFKTPAPLTTVVIVVAVVYGAVALTMVWLTTAQALTSSHEAFSLFRDQRGRVAVVAVTTCSFTALGRRRYD